MRSFWEISPFFMDIPHTCVPPSILNTHVNGFWVDKKARARAHTHNYG